MHSEKNIENLSLGRKMRKTKILKLLLALAAAVILLLFFAAPIYISSEPARRMILAKINSSIEGQVNFSTISMGWLQGIELTDFSFLDKAHETSITAKQIRARPHYLSILLGNLSLGRTVIDQPRVEINITPELPGQLQVLPGKTPARRRMVPLPLKKIDLVVNDGNVRLNLASAGLGKKTLELAGVNTRLNLSPPGRKTNFDIDLTVVDRQKQSRIGASGQIKPARKTGWALKGLSGDFIIEVNDLDLASLSPFFAMAGGQIQAAGEVSGRIKTVLDDGKVKRLQAKLEGAAVDITAQQLKGDRFVTNKLSAVVELQSDQDLVKIENFDIKTDWLNAQAAGIVPKTIPSLAEFVKPDSPESLKGHIDFDLAALLSGMPHTFGIKEGLSITSGWVSGQIDTRTKNGQKVIAGDAVLSRLAGSLRGKPLALSEPLTASVRLISDASGTSIKSLSIASGFCKAEATGRVNSLTYSARIDLAKLQAELGQFIDIGQYRMRGLVQDDGTMAVSRDKVNAAGVMSVKNLLLTSPQGLRASEPSAEFAYSFDADLKKNILNLKKLEATADFANVTVKQAVVLLKADAAKPLNLPIAATADLARLQPFAVMFASFPPKMQLAGTLQSQLKMTVGRGLLRIVTDATTVRNLRITYPDQVPFEQKIIDLILDMSYNLAERSISIKTLELSSPQINIRKTSLSQTHKADKTRLQGTVKAAYDLAAVSTVTAPFLPQGLRLKGKRRHTINFTSEYPRGQREQLWRQFNAGTKFGFDQAEYMGLTFGPAETDIQIKNGVLTIAPFSSTVNSGRFNFAAEADFREVPSLLRTPEPIEIMQNIQINDRTTRRLLMYFNPIFARAVNVTGTANFQCEKLAIPLAGGSRNDLEIVGTVQIKNLRLQASDLLSQILSLAGLYGLGADITLHPTRFVLRRGILSYDDMQMDIGRHPVNFSGSIGLDKTMNMTVTLPFTAAEERITLPLKGTLDHPEIDAKKLIEEQLKQQLYKELQKLLK